MSSMDISPTASRITAAFYKPFAFTRTSEISFPYSEACFSLIWQRCFYSPAGKLLLFSSSDDNSVRVHDLMQKKAHCIATFSEHVSAPTQICATSDSSLLVSVGRDKVLMQVVITYTAYTILT